MNVGSYIFSQFGRLGTDTLSRTWTLGDRMWDSRARMCGYFRDRWLTTDIWCKIGADCKKKKKGVLIEKFCPSWRTGSPKGSDWVSDAYGLMATIREKKKISLKLPSLAPVTTFKGRCTGRLRHGTLFVSPSRLPPFFRSLHSPLWFQMFEGKKR